MWLIENELGESGTDDKRQSRSERREKTLSTVSIF